MLKGTVFQGCLMQKDTENKIIVLNVDVCCVAELRFAAYVPESLFGGESPNGEVGGSLTVEAEGETEYLRIDDESLLDVEAEKTEIGI